MATVEGACTSFTFATAHRIVSRTRLKGFDTVYLGPGAEFRFELANRYRDLREAVAPNFTYRALVFDHLAGAQYRLTYTRNGVPGTVWTDFAARSAQVTTPASGTVADPVLLVRSGSQWVDPITMANVSATSLFSGIWLNEVETGCMAGAR